MKTDNTTQEVPKLRDILACAKAGFRNLEGDLPSRFSPQAWEMWISFRAAIQPSYKRRIVSTLTYFRDGGTLGLNEV